MNRLRFSLLAAMCWIVPTSLLWSAPVPGARTGLEQVPDTAPVVVHFRGVQGTRDRFVAMMKNALPDVLDKFQTQMDDFLENGRDGRKIRGLAKDGPIFVVLTELPKAGAPFPDPPPFAVILAVTDYKMFHDNILTKEERDSSQDKNGMEAVKIQNESNLTYFLDRKGYAVITPNEDVAKLFTKKVNGLNEKMSKEQAAKLLGADLGVFVNMDTLNKNYADEIKQAKQGIEQVLALGAGAGDPSQKKMVEVFKKAIGPIFQAVEDMKAMLTTIEMRPGGLALHLQSEMKENSATANLLQDSRPIAFKDLERMPAGRSYYSALKTSAALYKGLGSLMVSLPLSKGGEPSKEVTAALEELAKAGPTVRMDGFAFPMKGLQVFHYDDPAKAVAAQVKLLKSMADSDPKSIGLTEKPELKMNAETFGDFKLNSVQMAWDFETMAEPIGQRDEAAKKRFIEAMKGLLGEKTTLWFGTDGKSVVQVTASDWTAARKLLEQYSKGTGTIGEVKAFREARKEMPARTSFLGLIDAVRMFGTIMDVVRPALPPGAALPPDWPNRPAKEASTFVGIAVTLQPQRGSFDLFITASAAQEFYKAVVKPLVR